MGGCVGGFEPVVGLLVRRWCVVATDLEGVPAGGSRRVGDGARLCGRRVEVLRGDLGAGGAVEFEVDVGGTCPGGRVVVEVGSDRLARLGIHAPDGDQLGVVGRFDVKVARARELLGDRVVGGREGAADAVFGVSYVVVGRDGDGRLTTAVGPDVRPSTRVVMQFDVRAKTGLDGDGSRRRTVVVERGEQMVAAHALVGKDVAVFPTLLGAAGCDFFVDPDQVVDGRFHAVVVIVFVEDGRIAFGGEDVGVGEVLVFGDRVVPVGVVVLDPCDRLRRVDAGQSGMVEAAHVVVAAAVRHAGELVAQGEVKDGGAVAHRRRGPPVQGVAVAVPVLAHGKFARHCAVVEVVFQEGVGDALDVVKAVSLNIEGLGHPVARFFESVCYVGAVMRQIPAKGRVVVGDVGILRFETRVEVVVPFAKAAVAIADDAVCVRIFEVP